MPEPASEDERMMLRALDLAARGLGATSPNPAVGAVIVAGGGVVGEGWHERPGGPHAEVAAVRQAGEKARGGRMYVTLEPCAHQGRTPPCADMLARAGLSEVVVAMQDPNPLVAGKGAETLRKSGVRVRSGPFGELAMRLNEGYVKWVTVKRPFVTLKMAMTLDGKVATRTGDSRWITGEQSRRDVHRMRASSDVVLVGIGTVLADDPQLTARDVPCARQPMRVVLDSMARTPAESRVLDGSAPTAIAVSASAPEARKKALAGKGARIIVTGDCQVDPEALADLLGEREVTSVLCEGGPTVAALLLEARLVDKVVLYVAGKVVGGTGAPGPVGGDGAGFMNEAAGFTIAEACGSGEDVKLTAVPRREEADQPLGEGRCSPG